MLRISFPTSCQMRTFCAVRKSRVRTACTPARRALSFVPLRRIHIAKGTRGHGKIKKKKKQPSTRAELQSSLHHGDSFLHPVNFRNEERDKNRTLLIRRRKSFERLNCVCVTFSFWRIFIKIVKIDRERRFFYFFLIWFLTNIHRIFFIVFYYKINFKSICSELDIFFFLI